MKTVSSFSATVKHFDQENNHTIMKIRVNGVPVEFTVIKMRTLEKLELENVFFCFMNFSYSLVTHRKY